MAQNIEHKKSTLDDDASIYQKKNDRDESKTVKQRWAEMSRAEKKQHFKDYMIKPILFGVFIVLLVTYFLYTAFRDSKSNKFFLLSLNQYYLDNDAMEEHMDTLEEYWHFSKRERAFYSAETTSPGYSSQGNLATYLYAGSLNAIIGTKEQLEQYGYYFVNIREEVSPDILSHIPEEAWCSLTYETHDPDQTESTFITSYSAIYLKYTIFTDDINKDYVTDENQLILVIPVTGFGREDETIYSYDFLKYALGLELGE